MEANRSLSSLLALYHDLEERVSQNDLDQVTSDTAVAERVANRFFLKLDEGQKPATFHFSAKHWYDKVWGFVRKKILYLGPSSTYNFYGNYLKVYASFKEVAEAKIIQKDSPEFAKLVRLQTILDTQRRHIATASQQKETIQSIKELNLLPPPPTPPPTKIEPAKPAPTPPEKPKKSDEAIFVEKNLNSLILCFGKTIALQIVQQPNRLQAACRDKLEQLATHIKGNWKHGEMAKLLSIGDSYLRWSTSPFKKKGTPEKQIYDEIRKKLDACFDIVYAKKATILAFQPVVEALEAAETILQDYNIHQKSEEVSEETEIESDEETIEEIEDELQEAISLCKETLSRLDIKVSDIVKDKKLSTDDKATELLARILDKKKLITAFETKKLNELLKESKPDTLYNGLLTFLATNLANHDAKKVDEQKTMTTKKKIDTFVDFALFYEEASLVALSLKKKQKGKVLQAKRAVLLMELRQLAWQTKAQNNAFFTQLAGREHRGNKPFSQERLATITTKELHELYRQLEYKAPSFLHEEWNSNLKAIEELES